MIAQIPLFKFNIGDGSIQIEYSVFTNFDLKNSINFIFSAFFSLGVIFGDHPRFPKIFNHLAELSSTGLSAALVRFGTMHFIGSKALIPHTSNCFWIRSDEIEFYDFSPNRLQLF